MTFLITAGSLVGVDLAVKSAVIQNLTDGRTTDLGPVDLKLGYNTGAAFSIGNSLPSWVLIGITAILTLTVAGYAWHAAGRPGASWLLLLGLTAVFAGALGNLIDRAGDGQVTDYLYTSWFATFNLADVLITLGAAAVASSSFLAPPTADSIRSTDAP